MLPAQLNEQLLYCLRFALLGVGLGLFYDVLRALRVHYRLRRCGTAALDLLFCLGALPAFLLLMLKGTDGRLRGFLFLGLAGGFALYRTTLSCFILRGLLWGIKLAGQAVTLLQETVLWLFSFPRGN